MYPIRSRTRSASVRTFNPSTLASPALSGSKPVSILITVVLPLPLGPRNPKISPRATVKLTSFTAVKLPNFLTSPRAEIAGSVPSASPFALLAFAGIAISHPKVLRPQPFPPVRDGMRRQCEFSLQKPDALVLRAFAHCAAKIPLAG